MMFREAKLVALALFHTFLLAICAANGNQTCRPSSCGEIQNISNPFRLKGDPSGCGDPDYELVCENNRTMVNGAREGEKYYVADINYDHYTIRVVDPGVEKGNCLSTPLYFLTRENFDYYYGTYYLERKGMTSTSVLMNCEQPISDGSYIPITPCNATSSSSQAYVYALVGSESMEVGDIKYPCTISRTIITQFLKPSNLSMSDLQEMLLLGLEISFLSFRCKSECRVKGLYCHMNYDNNTVQCYKRWISLKFFFSSLLYLFRYLLGVDYFIQNFGYLSDGGITALAAGVNLILQLMAMIIVGRAVLGILCLFAYLIYKFRRRHLSLDDDIEEFLHNYQNLRPIKYTYLDIKKMTHNFEHKLGQGGFGSVYKGKL